MPDFVDALDAARQDDDRRRPAAPDLHRLPPGAVDRGARRAHAQAARRPDHRRDRARLPGARAHHRAAHRARQAHADGGAACRSSCPRATRSRARLGSVLEVVYLDLQRGLHRHARRRLDAPGARRTRRCAWAACWPSSRRDEPEVHGLAALMELQASRAAARVDAQGRPVLLLDQDRARWDRLLIRRGLAALERAEALAAARSAPYALQAGIAACHARAPSRRRHRLGAHRRALRRAGAGGAVAGGRAESRGGGGHGLRPGRRPGDRRRAARRARRSRATTGCRACAATCWPSSAATPRRAPNSSAPPR